MGEKKPFQKADDDAKAKRRRAEHARKRALAAAEARDLEFVRAQQHDLREDFYRRNPGLRVAA